MDLLKKHYEKLVLLLLMAAFIGSMSYVLTIIKQTSSITDKDLQIPTRDDFLTPLDPDKPEFKLDLMLKATTLDWKKSESRDGAAGAQDGDFSDLVAVFKMARCPFCDKIIPFSLFNGGQCPLCRDNQKLVPPPEKKVGRVRRITPSDLDGDGIPNDVERKYATILNENNPDDALLDGDKDGFSNLYEIDSGYSPTSPGEHPPLWYRLTLKTISTVPLPLRFMAVNNFGQDDKMNWELQFNRRVKDEDRTEYHGYSDPISIGLTRKDSKDYKVISIDLRQKKIPAATKNGEPSTIDESVVVVQEIGGTEKLTMKAGEPVFSPDQKAVFIDTGDDNKEIIVGIGDMFIMGNRDTRRKRYRVSKIDLENKKVFLEDLGVRNGEADKDEKGELMVVTRDGKIPEDMRIVQSETNPAAGENKNIE